MKLSEISNRIFEIENEHKHCCEMMYKEVINRIDNVFCTHKEYLEYEDDVYRAVKSFRNGTDSLQIVSMFKTALRPVDETTYISMKYDSMWQRAVKMEVPNALVKLIVNELEK